MSDPIKSYEFRGETLLPEVNGFEVVYKSKSYTMTRYFVDVDIGWGGCETKEEFDLHVLGVWFGFSADSPEALFAQAGAEMDWLDELAAKKAGNE